MSQKQKEYWEKLMAYIVASNNSILEIEHSDGDVARAQEERDRRLKLLTDNYTLSKKSLHSVLRLKAKPTPTPPAP